MGRKLPTKEVGECRIFQGALKDGYGVMTLNGKWRLVHRAMLEQKLRRPIKPGYKACHIRQCTSRACIEPAHLYEGTNSQNMRDKHAVNGGYKITQKIADEIRARYKRGNGIKLAQKYGISRAMVSRIVHGLTWQ